MLFAFNFISFVYGWKNTCEKWQAKEHREFQHSDREDEYQNTCNCYANVNELVNKLIFMAEFFWCRERSN